MKFMKAAGIKCTIQQVMEFCDIQDASIVHDTKSHVWTGASVS